MNKKIKFKIPCTEANHVCDKTQYKESSFWEKMKLNIHLIYCRACRHYTKNNRKLSVLIKKSKVTCMDKKDKINLKKDFKTALKQSEIN